MIANILPRVFTWAKANKDTYPTTNTNRLVFVWSSVHLCRHTQKSLLAIRFQKKPANKKKHKTYLYHFAWSIVLPAAVFCCCHIFSILLSFFFCFFFYLFVLLQQRGKSSTERQPGCLSFTSFEICIKGIVVISGASEHYCDCCIECSGCTENCAHIYIRRQPGLLAGQYMHMHNAHILKQFKLNIDADVLADRTSVIVCLNFTANISI